MDGNGVGSELGLELEEDAILDRSAGRSVVREVGLKYLAPKDEEDEENLLKGVQTDSLAVHRLAMRQW